MVLLRRLAENVPLLPRVETDRANSSAVENHTYRRSCACACAALTRRVLAFLFVQTLCVGIVVLLFLRPSNVLYALRHSEWPTFHDPCDTCSPQRCMRRCAADEPLSIYFYDDSLLTKDELDSEDYMSVRNALLPFRTTDASKACLFFPPVNTLCTHNRCEPPYVLADARLLRLPYWRGGENHILVGITDFDTRQGTPNKAINVRSNALTFGFRTGFDVSVALLPQLPPDLLELDQAKARTVRQRSLTIAFRGSSFLAQERKLLEPALVHQFPEGTVSVFLSDCHGCWSSNDQQTLHDQLLDTVFGLAPAGYGAHSYRLLEVMARGAIPVIIADDFVLPLDALVPWTSFSVQISWAALDDLPALLKSISDAEREKMRLRSLCAYANRT